MKEPRALKKQERSALVKPVEDKVQKLLQDNQVEDLAKIAAIWSMMLDLEDSMLPSLAAALLSIADIVRATTLVDSKEHWQNAAASAIIAIEVDAATFSSVQQSQSLQVEQPEQSAKVVGFAAQASD